MENPRPTLAERGLTIAVKSPDRLRNPEGQTDSRYSLVIFDFHGTMTDHQKRAIRAHHDASTQAFGTRHRKDFYQALLSRDTARRTNNDSTKKLTPQTNRDFVAERFGTSHTPEEIDTYNRILTRSLDTVYIPIAGIPRVVRELKNDGVEVAILTNGNNREAVQDTLRRWDLADLSEKRFYSKHTTSYRKPDPRTITTILDDLRQEGVDIPLEKVLIVGDYIDDIQTAANVGVDSVLMVRSRGGKNLKLHDPRPTYVITNAADLAKVVKGEFPKTEGDEVEIPRTLWKLSMAS